MESSLQDTKMELIQWVASLKDISVIQKIAELKENEDWWNHIDNQEKASIEMGISDAESGKLSSNDKAKEIYGKWL